MRYSIGITLILVLAGCNMITGDPPPEPISTVQLHGKVVGKPTAPILLQIPDPLAYDQPLILDTIVLDSVGRFSLAFDWSEPRHAKIDFGDQYIPLFLMPGDSIEVQYDLEADEVSFTGLGSAVNYYLQAFEEVRGQFTLYANLPIEEYLPRIDSLTAARMELLDELRPQALAEHPDHPFLELAQVEIEASRLEDLHQYPFIFKYVTNADVEPELPAEVRRQIEQYPINNDGWFHSEAYQSFVQTRFSDLIRDT
jgi:hypothetical protein